MVIISQWRSWQMNVFTLTEQLEVSTGILFSSELWYSDLCVMIVVLFKGRKTEKLKCFLERADWNPGNAAPNFRVCLRLGFTHSHTPLSWPQWLSQGWVWIQDGPIKVLFLSHVQSLGKRGWMFLLVDYQSFFLLSPHCCVCVCVWERESLSRVQPCDPMDCSQPGSSVQGILQARVLKWVAISFSTPYCCMEQNQLH